MGYKTKNKETWGLKEKESKKTLVKEKSKKRRLLSISPKDPTQPKHKTNHSETAKPSPLK